MKSVLFFPILFGVIWGNIMGSEYDQDQDTNSNDDLVTVVSTPAVLKEIPEVLIYTEEQDLLFTIPDLPKPPKITNIDCPETEKWCQSFRDIGQISVESSKLLYIMEQQFTWKGIPSVNYTVKPPPPNSDEDDPIQKQLISKVGLNWYNEFEQRMEGRTFQSIKSRTSRSPDPFSPAALLPIVKTLLPPIAKLGKKVGQLFLQKSTLKDFVLSTMSDLPETLKPFMNFPRQTSSYTTATKEVQKRINTANANLAGRAYVTNFDYRLGLDFYKIHGLEQVQQTNNVVHYSILMMGHATSLAECRSHNLPLLFVPPSVLVPRYAELKSDLPHDLELVVKDAVKFYKMKSANCLYDDDGGLLQLTTYLKPKSADYQMFEFIPTSFQYFQETCDLDVTAAFVIRDKNTGAVHVVGQTDDEFCKPKRNGLCRLPQAVNADGHYCLLSMLEGAPASEIKKSCKITCRKNSRITTTRVSDEEIIIAHLPKASSTVVCPNGLTIDIRHNINVGSLKFRLGCSCKIVSAGKIIAQSTSKNCKQPFVPFTMEHILPVHLSNLEAYMPDFQEGMRFKSSELIINEDWRPEQPFDVGNTKWFSIVVSSIASVCNWCLLWIFLYRYRLGPFAFLEVVRQVDAAKEICPTNNDVFYMLIAILALNGLIIVPSWIVFFYGKCRKVANGAIELAARRQLAREFPMA